MPLVVCTYAESWDVEGMTVPMILLNLCVKPAITLRLTLDLLLG